MLDLHQLNRTLSRCAYKGIFLLIFLLAPKLSTFEYYESDTSHPCEHEWVKRYFDSLTDSTSIEEVVDFLVSLRVGLHAKGYSVPSLADLCLKMKDYLLENEIPINEEEFQMIYNEIVNREGCLINQISFSYAFNDVSNMEVIQVKKKNKKAGFNVSNGFAIGFVKALGGALLCVIPHPITWTIGGALVADGIKDMAEHAGDSTSGENVEDRIRNLPTPPKYSDS